MVLNFPIPYHPSPVVDGSGFANPSSSSSWSCPDSVWPPPPGRPGRPGGEAGWEGGGGRYPPDGGLAYIYHSFGEMFFVESKIQSKCDLKLTGLAGCGGSGGGGLCGGGDGGGGRGGGRYEGSCCGGGLATCGGGGGGGRDTGGGLKDVLRSRLNIFLS